MFLQWCVTDAKDSFDQMGVAVLCKWMDKVQKLGKN
jgi:ABC-type transporter Mla MlaB component